MTDMAPDKGAGVVPIVYMTSFPPFGGGVHSMVTSDCPIPWMGGMESLRRTLLGEPADSIHDSLERGTIFLLISLDIGTSPRGGTVLFCSHGGTP